MFIYTLNLYSYCEKDIVVFLKLFCSWYIVVFFTVKHVSFILQLKLTTFHRKYEY